MPEGFIFFFPRKPEGRLEGPLPSTKRNATARNPPILLPSPTPQFGGTMNP